MSKIQFDHDSDKATDAIKGVDKEIIEDLLTQITKDPVAFFGDKKSQTAEWIHENANDPNALFALAHLITEGIQAIAMMAMLEQKTKESMAKMDIDPRMPDDMKKAIRQAKKETGVTSDTETSEQEIIDEFEKLKRKHS